MLIEIQGREKYITGLCVCMKGLLIKLCSVWRLLFSANREGPCVGVCSVGSSRTAQTPVLPQTEAITRSPQQCGSQALSGPDHQVPEEDARAPFPDFLPRTGGREPPIEPLIWVLSLCRGKACSHPQNTPFAPWISALAFSQVSLCLEFEAMTF